MSRARDIADGKLNSADINGGNIDNTTIGGTDPAAGSFTTITSTSTTTLGGNLVIPDNGTIGSTSVTDAITIDSSGNVGVGTTPSYKLDTYDTSGDYVRFATDNLTNSAIASGILLAAKNFFGTIVNYSSVESEITDRATGAEKGALVFKNIHSGTTYERMRIDSSGNVLVGTTNITPSTGTTTGIAIRNDGKIDASVSDSPHRLNRTSSDGDVLQFRKDGTAVGSIGAVSGRIFIGSTSVQQTYIGFNNNYVYPANAVGSFRDDQIDLGNASARYDDIYATNGTIQTSDRNEKQDIEELSETEQRVAVAAKGLLRKYRWKSAVAEKGDGARIHFGIIAQDLKAAFEAEGLDAGRYGMFIHSEWWEFEETYIDDDGVEQTRINTYDTEEEAPEGAVKKDRMGIRYSELLAFIIAAI